MEKEIKIYSEILGEENSPVLLMLHGWGHTHSKLLGMGNILKDQYCIHLIDLPGFGQSSLPEEAEESNTAWDTQQYAEKIINYMNVNGIKSASILGHSFGGRICLRLASIYSDRINEVILIDSAGLRPIRDFKNRIRLRKIKIIGIIIQFLKLVISEQFFHKLHNWFSNKYGSTDYKNAGKLKQVLIKVVGENLADNAKAIKKRTLILWGGDDTATPLYMAKLLNQFIVNSTLIVMKNKGHEPFSGLGLHLCVYHIINFLKNNKND